VRKEQWMIREQVEERSGTRAGLAGKVAVWSLTLLVAAFFVSVGAPKLGGGAVEQFVGWGYPGWFSYVIGAVEVGGAALLLLPRVAVFAAALLGANMLGAFATELISGGPQALLPVVLLVLLAVVGLARRRPLIALVRRRGGND
jgi:uncharacterized membrane protein YphA (DoxX/SURF4 family)